MSNFDPIRDCKHGKQKGKCGSCDLLDAADLIEQQAAEIDALKAHVERLREALNQSLISWGYVGVPNEEGETYKECEKRLEETPQQNLNVVRREAYADGYYQGFCDAWGSNFDWEQDHVHYGLEQSEIRAEQEYPSVKDGE